MGIPASSSDSMPTIDENVPPDHSDGGNVAPSSRKYVDIATPSSKRADNLIPDPQIDAQGGETTRSPRCLDVAPVSDLAGDSDPPPARCLLKHI